MEPTGPSPPAGRVLSRLVGGWRRPAVPAVDRVKRVPGLGRDAPPSMKSSRCALCSSVASSSEAFNRRTVDSEVIPREPGRVTNASHGQDGVEMVLLSMNRSEALLLIDGLQSMEYWDYATELDLPRRNGQVFLPEDDGSWWGEVAEGATKSMQLSRFDSCVNSPLGSNRRLEGVSEAPPFERSSSAAVWVQGSSTPLQATAAAANWVKRSAGRRCSNRQVMAIGRSPSWLTYVAGPRHQRERVVRAEPCEQHDLANPGLRGGGSAGRSDWRATSPTGIPSG